MTSYLVVLIKANHSSFIYLHFATGKIREQIFKIISASFPWAIIKPQENFPLRQVDAYR